MRRSIREIPDRGIYVHISPVPRYIIANERIGRSEQQRVNRNNERPQRRRIDFVHESIVGDPFQLPEGSPGFISQETDPICFHVTMGSLIRPSLLSCPLPHLPSLLLLLLLPHRHYPSRLSDTGLITDVYQLYLIAVTNLFYCAIALAFVHVYIVSQSRDFDFGVQRLSLEQIIGKYYRKRLLEVE